MSRKGMSIKNVRAEQAEIKLRGITSFYNELLFAVCCKFPDETRHQTALRYIRERENREVGGPSRELTEEERRAKAEVNQTGAVNP